MGLASYFIKMTAEGVSTPGAQRGLRVLRDIVQGFTMT
jgi:hypothetical protein